MKITAKVFMILSMIGAVIGFILCLIFALCFYGGAMKPADIQSEMSATALGTTYLVWAIVCIIPVIVGVFGLKKLKSATSKHDLIAPGVVVLLFCNIISGILMLAMPESAVVQNK